MPGRLKLYLNVIDNLVVTTGCNITIEPGVEVRFADGSKLEVRGEITAIGTAEDSITFTSNSSTEQGSWQGIQINNSEGPHPEFRYCRFLYASTAIYANSCGDGVISVSHSRFNKNGGGIGGSLYDTVNIDSCLFTNNGGAVRDSRKTVTNSVFVNNDYGINCELDLYGYNSTFINNSITAINGRRGTYVMTPFEYIHRKVS